MVSHIRIIQVAAHNTVQAIMTSILESRVDGSKRRKIERKTRRTLFRELDMVSVDRHCENSGTVSKLNPGVYKGSCDTTG